MDSRKYNKLRGSVFCIDPFCAIIGFLSMVDAVSSDKKVRSRKYVYACSTRRLAQNNRYRGDVTWCHSTPSYISYLRCRHLPFSEPHDPPPITSYERFSPHEHQPTIPATRAAVGVSHLDQLPTPTLSQLQACFLVVNPLATPYLSRGLPSLPPTPPLPVV